MGESHKRLGRSSPCEGRVAVRSLRRARWAVAVNSNRPECALLTKTAASAAAAESVASRVDAVVSGAALGTLAWDDMEQSGPLVSTR